MEWAGAGEVWVRISRHLPTAWQHRSSTFRQHLAAGRSGLLPSCRRSLYPPAMLDGDRFRLPGTYRTPRIQVGRVTHTETRFKRARRRRWRDPLASPQGGRHHPGIPPEDDHMPAPLSTTALAELDQMLEAAPSGRWRV